MDNRNENILGHTFAIGLIIGLFKTAYCSAANSSGDNGDETRPICSII